MHFYKKNYISAIITYLIFIILHPILIKTDRLKEYVHNRIVLSLFYSLAQKYIWLTQ